MAKGKNKKELTYDEPPDENFIVVTNPWGMPRSNRTERDANKMCLWLRCVFGVNEGIEIVFHMRTRDEVIVQMSKEIQIDSDLHLGNHRWGNFLKRLNSPDDEDNISSIFNYNYRIRGDPATHNWMSMYPSNFDMPPHFPIKMPYPRASWGAPPLSVGPLVLPLPPRQRPPTPTPPRSRSPPTRMAQPPLHAEETSPQAVPDEPNETNRFVPYQPPSHHPSHSIFPGSIDQNRDKHIKAEENLDQGPCIVKKLDPYEEEDSAFESLRSNEQVKEEQQESHSWVKHEDEDSTSVKPEPLEYDRRLLPDSTELYEPSPALMNALRGMPLRNAIVTPKTEPRESGLTRSPAVSSGPRTDYEPSTSLVDALNGLAESRNSVDVRSSGLKRPKVEEDTEDFEKKVKRERDS